MNEQVPPNKLSYDRFVWASLLLAGGMICLLSDSAVGRLLFPVLMLAFTFVAKDEETRCIRVTAKMRLCGVIIVVGILMLTRWLPKFDSPHFEASARKFISHPVAVLPLWSILQYMLYRHWRYGSKSKAAASPTVEGE